MKRNNCSNIKKIRKGCKDNFHAFMVKDAKFEGKYDFPIIPQDYIKIPKNLVSYDKINLLKNKKEHFCHFYIDDQKFDGPNGIWNGLTKENQKRGFNLSKFNSVDGIISPDFSTYLDMPKAMQIWNTYRNRAFGYYLYKLGFYVIPNVRWSDKDSYEYCFDGIIENGVVAVGSLGLGKTIENRNLFINGFIELINRKHPKVVIIYGSIFKELAFVLNELKVNYIHYDSETAKHYRGIENGNER